MIEPGSEPRECETFNGNVVLVPEVVRQAVGNLDGAFTHSMADTDYGLRARSLACEVWVAPGSTGECALNVAKGRRRDPAAPLHERKRIVRGPKGLPLREWLVFTRRHAGPLWPIFWLSPYGNTLLGRCPSAVNRADSTDERRELIGRGDPDG
jgi:GT2 family glycosyltransferase